jgi:sigma-B regulation protein RsbU (phosphoserine phosphatase)
MVDGTLIPEDEGARIAAVRRYDVLDTPADGAFDRITRLAATHFGTPISIVSIVDSDRIWFKSRHGVEAEQVGRDPGLCASAILGDVPWVVEDARVDPRTLANPLVAGDLGLRFYAGAPLITSEGHALGTLCVIDVDPREFSDGDAAVLAQMAALVVDTLELRLAARRSVAHELELRGQAERTARALQESLLPPELPRIAGAKLAALYEPADAEVVGGDFYDAFELADGACVLTVGDVSGKGASAAALTALARHTLRSASLSTGSPGEMLRVLNRAMFIDRGEIEIERFCTALVVSARAAGGGLDLAAASAGHPAALIRRRDESTTWLEAAGPPAGWFLGAEHRESTGRLERGDAIVLCTDGIIEARTGSGMLGPDGLERAVGAAPAGAGAADLIEALHALIASDGIEFRDDIAILILEVV